MRTVIIGSGNVAYVLALALKEAGMLPRQIFGRNNDSVKEIAVLCGCAYSSDPAELQPADLYIIAVSDRAIRSMASQLDFGDAVVAHTAGSVDINVLPGKIKDRAVFYPLQTFTKGRRVNFREVPVFIEGTTPKALDRVGELARAFSDNVTEMDSERRALVHLAAVFACNFTNYMYVVGEEFAKKAGAGFDILKPLIRETAAKALSADSPRQTQTGPAVRNDFQTKNHHGDLLTEKPALRSLYINLSNNIWETLKKK